MNVNEARAEFQKSAGKAWDALARYKFWMFGYHAGDCVKLNRREKLGEANPFKVLVDVARAVLKHGQRAVAAVQIALAVLEKREPDGPLAVLRRIEEIAAEAHERPHPSGDPQKLHAVECLGESCESCYGIGPIAAEALKKFA